MKNDPAAIVALHSILPLEVAESPIIGNIAQDENTQKSEPELRILVPRVQIQFDASFSSAKQ